MRLRGELRRFGLRVCGAIEVWDACSRFYLMRRPGPADPGLLFESRWVFGAGIGKTGQPGRCFSDVGFGTFLDTLSAESVFLVQRQEIFS